MVDREEIETKRNFDGWTILLYLVLLEFVVSIVMFFVGHLTGNRYFEGVGIGLLISWVTGGLAYLVTKERRQN
jgi:hypothetical protein